jgi:hypothetical protein
LEFFSGNGKKNFSHEAELNAFTDPMDLYFSDTVHLVLSGTVRSSGIST